MRTWNVEFRSTDKEKFEAIRSGSRRYEIRSPDHRYRDIKPGDAIRFVCGGELIEKRVTEVHRFPTIAAMIRALGFGVLYTRVATVAEAEAVFHQYPGYAERISRDGIQVMELA